MRLASARLVTRSVITRARFPEGTRLTLVRHDDGPRSASVPTRKPVCWRGSLRLARRIPGARLHILSNAGHGYPAQDPVGIHQLVTDFFRAN